MQNPCPTPTINPVPTATPTPTINPVPTVIELNGQTITPSELTAGELISKISSSDGNRNFNQEEVKALNSVLDSGIYEKTDLGNGLVLITNPNKKDPIEDKLQNEVESLLQMPRFKGLADKLSTIDTNVFLSDIDQNSLATNALFRNTNGVLEGIVNISPKNDFDNTQADLPQIATLLSNELQEIASKLDPSTKVSSRSYQETTYAIDTVMGNIIDKIDGFTSMTPVEKDEAISNYLKNNTNDQEIKNDINAMIQDINQQAGYGYLNYDSRSEAEASLQTLNEKLSYLFGDVPTNLKVGIKPIQTQNGTKYTFEIV